MDKHDAFSSVAFVCLCVDTRSDSMIIKMFLISKCIAERVGNSFTATFIRGYSYWNSTPSIRTGTVRRVWFAIRTAVRIFDESKFQEALEIAASLFQVEHFFEDQEVALRNFFQGKNIF